MSLRRISEKEEKTEACTFRLPRTLREKMMKYCEKTGASYSGLVRVAVEEFLEERKWKRKTL